MSVISLRRFWILLIGMAIWPGMVGDGRRTLCEGFFKIIYYGQVIAISKKFLWNNLPTVMFMFYILTGVFLGAFENFIIMRSAYLHAKNEGFPLIEPSTNLPMLYSFLKRTYTPGLDFTQRPFVRLPFFKYTSCFKCIALL